MVQEDKVDLFRRGGNLPRLGPFPNFISPSSQTRETDSNLIFKSEVSWSLESCLPAVNINVSMKYLDVFLWDAKKF